MSCEIRYIAQLLEITKYSKLFLGKDDQNHENWLQDALVSLSPTGEILIIARGSYLILLTSKWDSSETGDVKMKYSVTWQGSPCTKSGEITSVLCLPLLSHGHSASGADWNCIVVGYSSGTLKFYTEHMHQLLAEVLHAEPVLQIKCSLFKPSNQRGPNNSTDQEANESLYVLFKSVICVINGFSLFQTLRGCRNRLARQSASLQGIELDSSFPMDFKKYGFFDQDAITDASFIGLTSVNMFDNLVTASLGSNFQCNYRPSPPQTSLIIATGRKPFLGFHYTVEGGGNAALAGVALAVASKIKESVTASLPGWFRLGSGSEPDKMKVSQEPAEQLRCRFGLCDSRRHGNNIVTSPDGKLSAVSDSLGRILLIENYSGIARRLWKGYREAQCGFLEAEEDVEKLRHKKSKSRGGVSSIPRRALFLVIYAPRKGLIEVFAIQQGPCVASFKVSKYGRLIYTPYGLLGFNTAPWKGGNSNQFPVVFLSEDGIRDIIVPFHCGLRSDNSTKARDLHILKKMKVLLKEEHNNESKLNDEMFSFSKDLKTNEIKIQAIEMLMSHKQIKASAFMAVLNAFKEGFMTEGDGDFPKNLLLLVESLEKLLGLYILLSDLSNQPANYITLPNCQENEASLAKILLLSNKEMGSVLRLINTIKEIENQKDLGAKVNFVEKKEKCLTLFLSCFDFHAFSGTKADDINEIYLNFKEDLSDEKMRWIGEYIFGGIFYSGERMNDWKNFLNRSKLNPIGLMKCLTSYWLNKRKTESLTYELPSLMELIKIICSFADVKKISVEYNKPSPWWQSIRNYLKSSTSSVASLLAAMAFRSVTITIEQVKEISQPESGKKSVTCNATDTRELAENSSSLQSSSHNNGWENVSQDTLEWDILIVKLEDLALLNAVLTFNIRNMKSTRPKLDFEVKDLSLNYVLDKGDGYISELVAKWLIQFGLDPTLLIDHYDVEFLVKKGQSVGKSIEAKEIFTNDAADVEAQSVLEKETVSIILDYLKVLKGKFPFSLTTSSLLSNISWEYMAYWYRNVDDLHCLETSVEYLRNIPSLELQNGLSYLCWSTYVVQKFAAVAKLMNKFGKVPKDKFCIQELSLTSTQLRAFLKNCTEILSGMMETRTMEKKQFLSNQEGLWQNEPIGNSPSLITLALSQPKVNDELLELHYQLSMTLHMAADLNLKYPKLFPFFENVPLSEFFTDLAMNLELSSHSSNVILLNSRRSFLCKAVTGAVQTIEVVESIPAFPVKETEEHIPETRVNVEKSTKWISNCYDLARMWDIPLDDLRRHHVCELYSCGFDRLAEEILPAVNESSELASLLLVIAGKRLKIFIQGSSSLSKKLSTLSPNLSTWLECLVTNNVKNHSVRLDDLQTMLSYILKWRPIRIEEEKLALAMAESIPSLENEDCL